MAARNIGRNPYEPAHDDRRGVTAWDWMDEALCAEIGGDLFFPITNPGKNPRYEDNDRDWNWSEQARDVCHRCPVAAECDQWRKATNSKVGIWGGKGARMRRQEAHGEPGSPAAA